MPDARLLTPAVRHRAWGEVPVRPWAALAICLAVAGLVLAGLRWGDWRRESRVVTTGTPVMAEVVSVGLNRAREGSRDEAVQVLLRYTPPGTTTPVEAAGVLPRKFGAVASTKEPVAVRVDPQNPSYWTERTESPSFLLAMIAPLLCGVVAVACGLLAWIKRRGVLAVYRAGRGARATVANVRQSPLAPFSKLIGVTLAGEDRRIRSCYWPTRSGPVHPGFELDVIERDGRVLASHAYDVPAPLVPSPGTPGEG